MEKVREFKNKTFPGFLKNPAQVLGKLKKKKWKFEKN